jgi:hypothetical protein
MRRSLIQRTKDLAESDAPTQPNGGDVVIGCEHEPDPYHGAHFYWLASDDPRGGIAFKRPDGKDGVASWMLLCDACFVKHGGDIDGALRRNEIRIACDMVWPEGDQVNVVKH